MSSSMEIDVVILDTRTSTREPNYQDFQMIQNESWDLGDGNMSGNSSNFSILDYEIGGFSPPPEELVPVALVYGLTLLLGMLGNILVIISVTRYQRMRSITNIFLLSLASADLLLVCICIPVKFATFFTFTWTFGELLCKGVHYLQNVSSVCSVLTLTTMSVERYYAIRHPIRAKYLCTVGRAWRVTCILWTLSLVLAVPTLFQRIHRLVGHHRKAYWCLKDWESVIYSRMYELYMLMLMLVLPLIIMTMAYVSIIRELWVMSSFRSSMTSRGHVIKRPKMAAGSGSPMNGGHGGHGAAGGAGHSPVCMSPHKAGSARIAFRKMSSTHSPASSVNSTPKMSERTPMFRIKHSTKEDDDVTKKQIIKMLVAVIVVFVVCWAPILINNALTAFGYLHYLNYGYLKPMRQTFYVMAYANSCINPVIYGFMSKHFRKTFYHALCTCLKTPDNNRCRALYRQASWQSRSTNNRDLPDFELTSIDVTGGGANGPLHHV